MQSLRFRGSRVGALAAALLLGALLCGGTAAEAQSTVRVLVVGDSWSELFWFHRSLRDVFALEGHPEILEKGDVTAISGSTAAEWVTAPFLQSIADELAANPTIDTVQLSIGGNDFLAGMPGVGWYQGMPEVEKDALFARIAADVAAVIDFVLAQDPGLEVVFSSYDYTNFVESLTGPLGILCTGTWNDMAQPTPLEINTAALELSDVLQAVADARPRASAVSHFGRMHYVFGYPSMSIPPGLLEPPGDPTLPSPPEAMAFGFDCFHLNSTGYGALAQSLWDEYYARRFATPIFSDGFESGDVSPWSVEVP